MSLARHALEALMESRCGPPTALVSLASLHMYQVNYCTYLYGKTFNTCMLLFRAAIDSATGVILMLLRCSAAKETRSCILDPGDHLHVSLSVLRHFSRSGFGGS